MPGLLPATAATPTPRSPRFLAMVPESGSRVPARMRSSVDLPAPLRPTSPMCSPSSIPSDTPWNRGDATSVFETASRDSMFMRDPTIAVIAMMDKARRKPLPYMVWKHHWPPSTT